MIGKPNWRFEMIGDKCCAQRNNMTVSTRYPDSGPKNVLCHFSAQNQVLLHLKEFSHVTACPTLLAGRTWPQSRDRPSPLQLVLTVDAKRAR